MIKNYINRRLLKKEEYYKWGDYSPDLRTISTSLLDLITTGTKRIVLLGDAGYGKSTELQMVFLNFVEQNNPEFIPVLIVLDTYSDGNIENYVRLKIKEGAEELLSYNQSKLVFLFDEFDQVLDKGKATREMLNFVERYEQAAFIIACRTNFYSNQFQNFESYVLPAFTFHDVKEFVNTMLDGNGSKFTSLLQKHGLLEHARNPFFLTTLVNIFKQDNAIPDNIIKILDRIILLSLERDKNRLNDQYDLSNKYPTGTMREDLFFMSLMMETLQKNYISMEEFCKIIGMGFKRQVISQLSLIKKTFLQDGDYLQFQHNNFQEYMAAARLANEKLGIILRFICVSVKRDISGIEWFLKLTTYLELKPFGIQFNQIILSLKSHLKYKRLDKINPSWINTISFICKFRENSSDLLNYLKNNAPELALKFEIDKISVSDREEIFKVVFKKYTDRNIWLNTNRINISEMGKFAETKHIYDFLMKYAHSQKHFTHRYNAIELLEYMKDFGNDALYQLLLQYAKDKNENEDVRHVSLYALAKLGKIDKNTIHELDDLQNSENEMVLAGFYHLLQESPFVDEYVDVLLKGLVRTKEFVLVDVRWNIKQAIQKVTTISGIKKILNFYREHHDTITGYDFEISNILSNISKAYKEDKSIYQDMKQLAIMLFANRVHKGFAEVLKFFTNTNTVTTLFEEMYQDGIDNNSRFLAGITDEACIHFIVNEYQESRISDPEMIRLINSLALYNRDNYDRFLQIINMHTGKFLPSPLRNYEEEQKEMLHRKVEILLDKQEFIKEIEIIFLGQKTEAMSYDELEKLYDEEKYDKYNQFVLLEVLLLIEKDKIKEWTFAELKMELDGIDYEWFMVSHIYDLLNYGSALQLNPEAIRAIEEFCVRNLDKVDFRSVIQQKGETTSITYKSLYIWFFMRKYKFTYPKTILLDMLSFDWTEQGEFVGIDYLSDLIPFKDIETRILENLDQRIVVREVLRNHINFCIKHKIIESVEYLEKIVLDKDIVLEDRLLALEALIVLDSSNRFIESLLDSREFEIFEKAARALLLQNKTICINKLINNLCSGKEDFALGSAEILISNQNLEGLIFYADHLKKTKKFSTSFRQQSPLNDIRTIDALPILLDLLKFSIEFKKEIEEDRFYSLYSTVINVLKRLALENYSNFSITSKALKKFIYKHHKTLSVNFLHRVLDDVEDTFYANLFHPLTIDEARERVSEFLHT